MDTVECNTLKVEMVRSFFGYRFLLREVVITELTKKERCIFLLDLGNDPLQVLFNIVSQRGDVDVIVDLNVENFIF